MKVATITKPVKSLWSRSEKSMTTSTMFSYCYSSTIKPASHTSVFQPSLRSISSSSFHLRPKSWNFISLNESSSFPGNSISINTRNLCVVSTSKSGNGSQESSFQGAESFFRSVLASLEKVYLNRNPTAKQILGLVQSVDSNQICYDHLAFRTFGEIIRKYTDISSCGNEHAALASALGSLTWENPLFSEFQQLARESEYAAWTLVNGYALNHATISTHQLKFHLRNINNLNRFIEDNGFKLNSEGGVLKVSPDGLLLQSSTVADSVSFQFSDGITELVPCSYIEFAERLVLPQYKNIPEKEVKEFHRRDGFEVGNADKIFESTSKEQLTRRAA